MNNVESLKYVKPELSLELNFFFILIKNQANSLDIWGVHQTKPIFDKPLFLALSKWKPLYNGHFLDIDCMVPMLTIWKVKDDLKEEIFPNMRLLFMLLEWRKIFLLDVHDEYQLLKMFHLIL